MRSSSAELLGRDGGGESRKRETVKSELTGVIREAFHSVTL